MRLSGIRRFFRRLFQGTDRELARLQRAHLVLANASLSTLKDPHLCSLYHVKAFTVYNQRVAICEEEQRSLYLQAQARHDSRGAERHLSLMRELHSRYVSLPAVGGKPEPTPSVLLSSLSVNGALPSPLSVTYVSAQSVSSREMPSVTPASPLAADAEVVSWSPVQPSPPPYVYNPYSLVLLGELER